MKWSKRIGEAVVAKAEAEAECRRTTCCVAWHGKLGKEAERGWASWVNGLR